MNNILIFSPTPSHPQNAGNRSRIYNLAKYLQENGHTIHFVYFIQEGLTEEQELAMSNQWDSLTIIKKEKHYKLSTPTHYLIDDWYQENLGPIIREKCIELEIDIILLHYIFQSKLLEFIPNNIVKIIDTIDRFSDRHLMQIKHGVTPDYFYTIQSEEVKALNRADIILAIQDNEAEFFRTLTDKRVEVLGHIGESHYLNKKYTKLEKIGFIGSPNSANLKSLLLFIDKFINYIDTHNYDLELIIAGSICTKIQTTHKSIKLLGYIDNTEDFYSNIDLIINPLILGTGLKIKSIEALSYGVPIISTDIGFDGIESSSAYHFSQDTNELIQTIDTIYTHPKLLQNLAQQSQEIFDNTLITLSNTIEQCFKSKNEMPKLLFITHINFWEKDLGSRMRLFNMLNYIKAYFSITIMYTQKRRTEDYEKLKETGYEKQVVFLDELTESDINENKITVFLNEHPVLNNFYNNTLYKKMQTYINENHFNNVIIEYIHLSYFIPLFEKAQCFLDSIDMMNIRNELFKQNNKKHWINISEAEEFKIFKLYHKVLAIQKNDYSYLMKNNIPSLLVSYSLSTTIAEIKTTMKNIIFIGGDTEANIEAINWFIVNVWPFFTRSGLRLEIYGTVSKSIKGNKDILNEQNIFTMGRVDDLDNLYSNCTDLLINPVHMGGGLKIKNAEALASGLPLITTTEGANGLEDGINDVFLLANTPNEWIDAIIALMISKDLRTTLAKNALDYAKNNFSERVCYSELIHLITEGNK